MPSAGFETAIPSIEQPETYALARTAAEICSTPRTVQPVANRHADHAIPGLLMS
jgi:hypothetical protein